MAWCNEAHVLGLLEATFACLCSFRASTMGLIQLCLHSCLNHSSLVLPLQHAVVMLATAGWHLDHLKCMLCLEPSRQSCVSSTPDGEGQRGPIDVPEFQMLVPPGFRMVSSINILENRPSGEWKIKSPQRSKTWLAVCQSSWPQAIFEIKLHSGHSLLALAGGTSFKSNIPAP